MKKNFFKFLLLGAFTLSLGVGFVGCKDYDDEIDDLYAKIEALKGVNLEDLKAQAQAAYNKADAAEKAIASAQLVTIAQVQAEIQSAIAGLQGGGLTQAQVDALLTPINSKLTALGLSLDGLGENATAQTIAQLEFQAKVIELFGAEVPAQLTALIADLKSGAKKYSDVDWDAVTALVSAINPNLNVAGAAGMITDIILYNTSFNAAGHAVNYDVPQDILFETYGAIPANFTFLQKALNADGAGIYENAISFVRNERIAGATATVTVKVTPANANLEALKSKITLKDSKGNDLSAFLTVKSVVKSDVLLTRSTLPVGLWDVTFELDKNFVANNFNRLILSPNSVTPTSNNHVLFALAVNTEADRYVSTRFDVTVDHKAAPSIYNKVITNTATKVHTDYVYTVSKEGTPVAQRTRVYDIRNRYNITDGTGGSMGAGAPIAAPIRDNKWHDGYSTSATPYHMDGATSGSTDDRDNASSYDLFLMELGQTYDIHLTNYGDATFGTGAGGNLLDYAYAWIVTIDKKRALESSPTEINAWNAYETTMTGINQVVLNDGSPIKISVNDPTAVRDVIAFNVWAINADGTMIDPDGRQFLAYITPPAAGSTLAFETQFVAPVAQPVAMLATSTPYTTSVIGTINPGVSSDVKAFTMPAGVTTSATASYTFTMDLETVAGNNYALDHNNVVLTNATGGVVMAADVGSWNTVRGIQLVDYIPSRLKEGQVYTGTITISDGTPKMPVAFIQVTLVKNLPGFPAGVEYKTGVLRGGKVWAYPMLVAAPDYTGEFLVNSAFNINNQAFEHPLSFGDYANGYGFMFEDKSPGTGAAAYLHNLERIYYGAPSYIAANASDTKHVAELDRLAIGVSSLEVLNKYTVAATANAADAITYDATNKADREAAIKDYVMNLTYGWGHIKYDNAVPAATNLRHSPEWGQNPTTVLYRSFVQDFVLSWTNVDTTGEPMATGDRRPVLVYNYSTAVVTRLNSAANASDIMIQPIVGTKFNLVNTNPNSTSAVYTSPDGARSYRIVGASLWTGATNEVENEYLTPNVNATLGLIRWEKTSGSSAPAADVVGKLTIDIMDEFGHVYRLPVLGDITMKLQN